MRRWMPRIPSAWRTDVTVITSSGRDRDGKRLPGSETTVKGVFVAPTASEEEGARSEATTDTARLYLAPEHGSIPSTAQIRIPKPHMLSGTWAVKGEPAPYPKGTVLNLWRVQ